MDAVLGVLVNENLEENRVERVRRKILRDNSNILELPETVFRISKGMFVGILREVESEMKPTSIPLTHKLGATLRFLAEGSYQRSVGKDFDIGLGRSTVSKILGETLNALQIKLCSKWIKLQDMPVEEGKIHFLEKFGIPGVVGCLDGTYIRIIKPHQNSNLFYNRKGYFSINALIICDHKMMIRAIDATRPGASHDALIWQMSDARNYFVEKLENGEHGAWLLGDAGFGLEPFVLTPYKSAQPGTMQYNFNKKHSAARNVVERTIGNLKTRFRCLLNTLNYQPVKATKIINVCCALHNMCKSLNLEFDEESESVEEIGQNFYSDEYGEHFEEARRIRDSIAQNLVQ